MKKIIFLCVMCALLSSCDMVKDGTLTWNDGIKYVGQHKNGIPHGNGTYTSPDGNKYSGEWKDGEPHGQGTYTWPDGAIYVGQFKNGIKNGHGTLTYTDFGGRKYVGQFKDGAPHGEGTMTYNEGTKYTGQWERGYFDGQGIYIWTNGDKYTGQWRYSVRYGQGAMSDASGVVFQKGAYLYDEYIGEGEIYTYPGGEEYVGQIKDGKPHGHGTMFYSEEKKYTGQWKDGKRDGQGKTTTIIYKGDYLDLSTTSNRDNIASLTSEEGIYRDDKYIGKGDEKPGVNLGALIGFIGGFDGGDVVVNGNKDTIGTQAPMGRALIVNANNGQYVYLQSTFPMQTVVKCKITSGDRSLIKKGMKVYLKP